MDFWSVPVSLISGGAFGAGINEYFRRRRSLTQEIPLIERTNRNPMSRDVKGIRFFRGSDNELVEVRNLREFQMTLRNTTEQDLQGTQIQFEFHGAAVEGWAQKTRRARASLNPELVLPTPGEPSLQLKSWTFSQFPAGDSVEFGFLVIDPADDRYDATLLKTNNVVIRIFTEEPPAERLQSRWTLGLALVTIFFCVLLAVWLWRLLPGHGT